MRAAQPQEAYPVFWNLAEHSEYRRLQKTDPAAAQALYDANDAKNRELGIQAAAAEEKEQAIMASFRNIYDSAPPVPPDHPSVRKLGVKPYDARLYDGRWIVPMKDWEGETVGLRTIDPKSGTENLCASDASWHGSFTILGDPVSTETITIYIAFTYQDAAIIYQATGDPVMIISDPNSLYATTMIAAQEYGSFKPLYLIICPDSFSGDENSWLLLTLEVIRVADDAKRHKHGILAMLDYVAAEIRLTSLPKGMGSYGELARRHGMEAVLRSVAHTRLPGDAQ
ncbi:hypothetical protein [Nitrosovibrio sp. Nv17]|uniref:hypothetical protein n=1 Tax=Nitrosovibrio sp. Nv17 TaxID=1855339 RepID=UPI0009088867|nr:hypothetical protein [Nitrosovibrio sp. Nv17]SFW19148.1 hypothetical protein SAMN05216414_10510 [Nitrosovibrio sp. Nv17]